MLKLPSVSAKFLADLDAVCPKGSDGDLPATFLGDLDFVCPSDNDSDVSAPS
jgi:hypothetical protein